MNSNVCHFIPYHKDYYSIHTINYVLETKEQQYYTPIAQAVYKMYYVCNGNGFIHVNGKKYPLSFGDVFFTFPSVPFCIESGEDFAYMYISFLGSRCKMIMERLKISRYSFHFTDCDEICDYWKNGLNTASEFTDLISESILLYTFCFLGRTLYCANDNNNQSSNTALMIKKYIDDSFSDSSLCLNSISNEFSYNKKYISTVFKKSFGVGISKYLNTIRIQHACTLIRQGYTSVCDISYCCGYSDPQYFSKKFKQIMGVSPTKYKAEAKKK